MMKLMIIAAILGAAYSDDAVFKCFKGAAAAVTEEACTGEADIKCSGPSFSHATGINSVVEYACGACAGNTKAEGSCDECETTGCNKLLVAGDEFKCNKYKFENEKFEIDTETTCKSLKDAEDNMCNKPGAQAKLAADYTMTLNGCGKCSVEQEVTDKKCEQTAGAMGLSALLLPLIAAIYTLF